MKGPRFFVLGTLETCAEQAAYLADVSGMHCSCLTDMLAVQLFLALFLGFWVRPTSAGQHHDPCISSPKRSLTTFRRFRYWTRLFLLQNSNSMAERLCLFSHAGILSRWCVEFILHHDRVICTGVHC